MDQRLPLGDVAALARRAERLGYTGLQVPEAVHDGFLTALLALQATRELRVATSVALAFPRSPTVVAYAAWDLQTLSDGRFVLGLGSQVKPNLEGRYGVAWTPPVPRMREYVAALRAIFRCWQDGERLDFAGEHYRLDRMQPFFVPEPLATAAIPIWLGAVGPRMSELAGEVADGLVTHPTNASPLALRELTRPAIAAGAARSGRDPAEVAVLGGGFVATGATREAVAAERQRIRGYLGFLYSTPAYGRSLELAGQPELGGALRKLARQGRWDEMPARIPDALLDALVPAGAYAEIADVLGAWYGGLCRGIAFPLPEDPAHDAAAGRVVAALRS
jgi:probable F420-dependent oxidoreductase